jgi:serine/threonine protein kinase
LADELEDMTERLFRQAEIIRRLNHPHVVTIFEAGEDGESDLIAAGWPRSGM